MDIIFGANTFFFEYSKEVLRLKENHRKVLRLCFNILLKDDIFEELLCGHVHLQEVNHQHDHDFDRLFIQL